MVFLNDFRDMNDYREQLPRVLEELKKAIKDSDLQADIKYRTDYSLKIELRAFCVCGEGLGVDILPAFNNIKSAGMICLFTSRPSCHSEMSLSRNRLCR